ncbi:hypothetical protein CCYN49044_200013 [Capnocytophaga cynodegmi]|nr:hypothetical protein CCYN49044_200013 [Capnocytophaga cynodegmi]
MLLRCKTNSYFGVKKFFSAFLVSLTQNNSIHLILCEIFKPSVQKISLYSLFLKIL